ncbi:hypothetical protein Chor_002095 [Crotalus horridus]
MGIVSTEGGLVEGVNKKLGLFGDYMDTFKGIPFAAPTKTLEDPQPHPGWPGTLQADKFQKRCMQSTLTQTDIRGSEDCLYLNIWVPQGKKQVSTNLPVMIWIYGGAFVWGGGQGANFLNNYLYDGEEIASRGKVIVVTLNYRLGPLGFLSTGDAALPGNYGLKDQHMAIAWVKRNIKNFGGDPDNITIFGESAGAVSVSLQTLSPYNKGLIRRALSQSGVGLCPWAIQKDPLYWAIKIAHKVGCPADNTTVMASCLRGTDPKTLTLAFHLEVTNLRYPLVHYLAFTPVVDGDFIPDHPKNLFANTADIDYLVGGLTVEKGPAGADAAYALYTQMWSNTEDQEVIKRTVVDVETDYIFLVPTQQTLQLHRENANDPNQGESEVPIAWVPYNNESAFYLDINHDINYQSVKQGLRALYVKFWNVDFRKLPDVRSSAKRE